MSGPSFGKQSILGSNNPDCHYSFRVGLFCALPHPRMHIVAVQEQTVRVKLIPLEAAIAHACHTYNAAEFNFNVELSSLRWAHSNFKVGFVVAFLGCTGAATHKSPTLKLGVRGKRSTASHVSDGRSNSETKSKSDLRCWK